MIFLLQKHKNTQVTLLLMVTEFKYVEICWLSVILCDKHQEQYSWSSWTFLTSAITNLILKFTGKQCMVDSGGYTMKCRSVKPNPWDVRHKRTVFGLGHENGSSSAEYCAAEKSAMLLHSVESLWKKEKDRRRNSKLTRTNRFLLKICSYEILKLKLQMLENPRGKI